MSSEHAQWRRVRSDPETVIELFRATLLCAFDDADIARPYRPTASVRPGTRGCRTQQLRSRRCRTLWRLCADPFLPRVFLPAF
jgi:hypothetical protein